MRFISPMRSSRSDRLPSFRPLSYSRLQTCTLYLYELMQLFDLFSGRNVGAQRVVCEITPGTRLLNGLPAAMLLVYSRSVQTISHKDLCITLSIMFLEVKCKNEGFIRWARVIPCQSSQSRCSEQCILRSS